MWQHRKNVVISIVGLFAVSYIYFAYFYARDPTDILLANQKLQEHRQVIITGTAKHLPLLLLSENETSGKEEMPVLTQTVKMFYDKGEVTTEKVKVQEMKKAIGVQWDSLVVFDGNESLSVIQDEQRELWNNWVKENGMISVGEYYNHCGEETRVVIGKFVIVKSEDDWVGVKFQSYLNLTWMSEVPAGSMYLEVSYAEIPFLKMRTNLCTSTKKTLKCPLKSGFHSFAVDFRLPFFLPKGQYRLKAYGETVDKKMLACVLAEAVI